MKPYLMNWSRSPSLLKSTSTVTKYYAEQLCVTVQTSQTILAMTNICDGVFDSKVAGYKLTVLQSKFSISIFVFCTAYLF